MWTRAYRAMALLLPTLVGVTLVGTVATASTSDLGPPTSTTPVTGTATADPWSASPPTLVGVRVGRHETYDRTVFDFTGGTPAYEVQYGQLISEGRGEVIPLAGGVPLSIVFKGAFAYDINTGRSTIDLGQVLNPNFPTLKQVKFGGAFEGHIRAGLGLNDRVGFRVLQLTGPPRIAIDVAHQPTQPFTTNQFLHANGTSDDASIDGVRAGRHPGYDRLVFDMRDAGFPIIVAEYASASSSTINLTFEAIYRSRADYTGPPTVQFGMPELKSVTITPGVTGILNAQVSTAARHGFRVMLLQQPTRIVLDVAY
jgi:hypothetical protein